MALRQTMDQALHPSQRIEDIFLLTVLPQILCQAIPMGGLISSYVICNQVSQYASRWILIVHRQMAIQSDPLSHQTDAILYLNLLLPTLYLETQMGRGISSHTTCKQE